MSGKRKMALFSGFSLIAMALAAGYAYGYVYGGLIDMNSPQDTYRNLRASGTLFRNGMVAWGAIVLLDLLVAGSLYGFLKEVHPRLSALTALIRALYAFILLAAVAHLVEALALVEAAAGAIEVLLALQRFELIWSQGLILFGFHLFGMGLLSVKARFVPSFFGWLLLVAGCCYTGIHLAKIALPGYAQQIAFIEMIASVPMALAEIGLAFWLVFRGGKRHSFQPVKSA
ncbi:DUF4386 domain-containing protein [Cyclobacterium jeungdonense]|uniref:DUF4386 domain-containing protein n=1 Tax=Cyclobacterium jeungdonense TaxID=708087 RepID=A0ABT8CC05_9BACT|nr:DUF4386 domain-containing protein [Cyclobacterium jeungdonense]MDN3689343.1 DUF4386 domain-containing protein [Cyclobacterium jeungdonense]